MPRDTKITITAGLQLFFSVALVPFSDQNWNSLNDLFNLHHRVTCASKKQFLISLNKLLMPWYMITYNYQLFPTLSIAYVMLNAL